MSYNKEVHHRRSIRLRNFNYCTEGYYFITVCTHERYCLFGKIQNGKMLLNVYGNFVENEINNTKIKRKNIDIENYVIMPNHIHLVIQINEVGAGTTRRAPTDITNANSNNRRFGKPQAGSILVIIGVIKAAVTKNINICNNENQIIWQRNYYEHIIRNSTELDEVRYYISKNPEKWKEDIFYKEI